MTPLKLKPKPSCGSPSCNCARKTRLFGPATRVAIVFACAVGVIGILSNPSIAKPSVVHSDRVNAVLKPTPADILHRQYLNLSKAQSQQIQSLDQKWQVDRNGLIQQMGRFHPGSGRLDQVSSSLSEYSQLSRLFDLTRQSYWIAACQILTPEQSARLQRGNS